jgi:hypothetical protein
MRSFPSAGLALLFLLLGQSAAATAFTGENASFVGADLVGQPISLGGDLVLEIDGGRGLIRDYSYPGSPAWVGAFSITDGLIERGVYDDGLFIGLHNEMFMGATLFGLADPAAPVLLSSNFAPYHFTSAILHANRLYLTTTEWLVGYDITNPANPIFSTLRPLNAFPGHRWPALRDDLLYLLDGPDRLRLFDLGDIGAPIDLGVVTLPTSRVDALVIADSHLHALQTDTGGLELATYALVDPLAPAHVGAITLAGAPGAWGTDLVAQDHLLLAATSDHRLRAFSIAAPAQPAPGFELPYGPDAITIAPRALLLYDENTSLRVMTRTAFDQPPVQIAERRAFPTITELETNGRVSVAAEAGSGDLLVIDLADPRSPVIAARWTGADARELAIAGNLVAACGLVDMRIFDVADPYHPVLISMVRYPSPDILVRDCAMTDDLLAVGLPSHGTLLYDIADPAAPSLAFTLRQVRGKLELAGDLLLTITGTNRASAFDVSDPYLPQWYGLLPQGGVRDAAISLGRVAMLTSGGLYLFEINGNDDFTQLSRTPIFNASRLITAGRRVYAFATRDVYIVNVADPVQPTIDGWFAGDATILALAAGAGLIHADMGLNSYLVKDETWSVTAAPGLSPPLATVLLAPSPNPFNPAVTIAFAVSHAQPVRLTIHDLRGRLVAQLASGEFAAGRHQVTWQGEDDGGKPQASGVYLVRLVSDDAPQTRRVTLIR